MIFTVRPTGQHQAVQDTITHTPIVLVDSAQLPMGGTVTSIAAIHPIPRGDVETMRNPTVKREVLESSQKGLEAYPER